MEELLKEMKDPVSRMDLIDESLCPPEPQLLDTCVLQNLDWVDRQIEAIGQVVWDNAARVKLAARYGADMASDLIDLGILYKKFEDLGGYPWLVCETNKTEASIFLGNKGPRLRQIVKFFGEHQDAWDTSFYPGVSSGLLNGDGKRRRVSPLTLKGLGIESVEQLLLDDGPLSFMRDEGDRAIAGYALIANIPAILTTDRNTFWAHREALKELGTYVFRPSELLELYEPYWTALSNEFERRQRDSAF